MLITKYFKKGSFQTNGVFLGAKEEHRGWSVKSKNEQI
jgi:hypothetical protein